jgi:hypothetical protein
MSKIEKNETSTNEKAQTSEKVDPKVRVLVDIEDLRKIVGGASAPVGPGDTSMCSW